MTAQRVTAQSVIVSAGAAGIGQAIVQAFRKSGAQVAICDADATALEAARHRDGVFAAIVDVADESECRRFVELVEAEFGGVDVLINNAGIAGAQRPIAELDAASWRRSFAVNVDGAFHLMKAVTPGMRERGGGVILNISTSSTTTLPTGRADYIASKWALEGLTRAAARELGPCGIRVNAIRPGFIDSERMRDILAAQARQEGVSLEQIEMKLLDFISLRAKISPDDIGAMALFLASPAARHVSGQIVAVDGHVQWES